MQCAAPSLLKNVSRTDTWCYRHSPSPAECRARHLDESTPWANAAGNGTAHL